MEIIAKVAGNAGFVAALSAPLINRPTDSLKKDKAPAVQNEIKSLVLKASVDWDPPLYDSIIDSSPASFDTLTITQE